MRNDLVKRDSDRPVLPLVRLLEAGAVVKVFLALHLHDDDGDDDDDAGDDDDDAGDDDDDGDSTKPVQSSKSFLLFTCMMMMVVMMMMMLVMMMMMATPQSQCSRQSLSCSSPAIHQSHQAEQNPLANTSITSWPFDQ